ncbi:MAG: GcrA family cell cycle regulator [Alphaproteobacteria bacterium]|nr:GcrA family cell cycle regulator [Alphaproteobacteria bacterium]
MGWTEERVAELKKLWAEGHSASQIAKRLGSVTRNAVIGKVHRLGLSGRATPSRPVKRSPRLAQPKPHHLPRQASPARNGATGLAVRQSVSIAPLPLPDANIEPLLLPNGDMVTVMTVKDSMCKWPIGDPADSTFGFCGRGSCHGSPYCADHARVAFQPAKKRERRAREFDYIQRLAG